MGSFCASKPAKTETSQTQTYTADPRVAAAGEQTLNMAQSAASQPFQMPAAPVAGFNPFQQQAFDQYQGMQGGLDPYFQNAGAQMTRAQSPVTQAETDSYMNPYADQALANMKKYVFDPQRTQTMGQATKMAGGVGAGRLALTSQNIDKTQADAIGGAQAGFYGQAMSQAQRAKEMALQSASGWANLGLNRQTGNLQATGALAGAGAQQQAQSQRELMSPYEQRLAEIAYPMQQASFLSGITGNMSNVFKGTSNSQGQTTSYAAQPSMFNQIAGLGMAAAGAYMGNPGMAMSGLSGAGGGGTYQGGSNYGMGGYGGAQAGYDSNGNYFQYADGGSVNPWDMGQGFAPGGDVELYSPDEFNRMDEAATDYSRPLERPAPNLGMWPFNRGQADYKGDVTMFPQTPSGAQAAQSPFMPQEATASGARSMDETGMTVAPPVAPEMPPPPSQTPWNVNDATPVIGAYKTMPPSTDSEPPQMPRMRPAPPPPRSGPYPVARGVNSDMKMSDFSMPKGEQPYPDATDRDWGQKMTRSPWMSLVHAGLKMAQSTKSGAAGLAEGLESGAKHLDTQRKELRSEQQINQRAEGLYRQAKSELDKYTRKTPHQLATEQESTRYHNILGNLGKERISAQMATGNLVYAGPVKDQPGMGYFYDKKRLDENGKPAVFIAPFDPGERPGTAAKSGKVAAHNLYKQLYPEDAKGAQDILRGHKSMSKDDVRKSINSLVTNAMKAQPIQPGTTEWLEEHKRRSDELMAKYNEENGL